MRRVIALVGLAACYAPTAQSGAPCDPTSPACPSGQACTAGTDGFFCSSRPGGGSDGTDAAIVNGDAPMLTDGQTSFCYGTGLVSNVCFTQAPAGALAFAGATTINTATVGGNHCTLISPQVGGGGGGGGGGGRVFQVAPGSLGGTISPPPS